MPENNMRELPRYIEERKMIGTLTAKNFIRLLPFWIVLAVVALNIATPIVVFICAFTILITYLLLSELSRNYTILDLLKDFSRYKREGNQYSERSVTNEPEYKKITLIEIDRTQE